MPAPNHTQDTQEDDPAIGLDNDQNHHNQEDDKKDSDRSSWSIQGEKNENVTVMLSDIRRIVQCPICLGIIRKTRTVMECLHRFCRECIDKSMRLGNNECPACRTHCASRRSLRDDQRYDAFIASLYPDIDKYEEEELGFQVEEKARNIQIQASIAQAARRQTEALSRKRSAKATEVALVRRSSNCRNAPPRRRRNSLVSADCLQESDDNEDANENEGGKDSSSDEKAEEKKCNTLGGAQLSQSSEVLSVDEGRDENEPESNKEFAGLSPGLVGSSDRLSWGKGGIRSRGNGKNSRNSRIMKLVDHLQNSENNDDELDIHITLVSFDKQSIPSLERPYLYCRLTLSVRHLCQYVASQTTLEASEVEICLVEELAAKSCYLKSVEELTFETSMMEHGTDKLVVLNEQDTLAEVKARNIFQAYLVLVYRKKLEN